MIGSVSAGPTGFGQSWCRRGIDFAPGRKTNARFGEDVRIGKFASFDLSIRSGFNNSTELVLRGRNSYSTRVTDTALGTIRSFEATVQGFEACAAKLEADIKDAQKRAGELETKVGATFEKEEQYHFLVKRQSDIEDKLDPTKNQAPAQAETSASETSQVITPDQIISKPKLEQSKKTGLRV